MLTNSFSQFDWILTERDCIVISKFNLECKNWSGKILVILLPLFKAWTSVQLKEFLTTPENTDLILTKMLNNYC